MTEQPIARPFTCATLCDFDEGRVGISFDNMLDSLIRDIMNRPLDQRDRVLNVQIQIVPLPRPDGHLEIVETNVEMKTNLPKRTAQPARMQIKPSRDGRTGMLVWNPGSPGDPRQMTLRQGQEAEAANSGLKPGEKFDPETGEIQQEM